jgi:hypothetical protein
MYRRFSYLIDEAESCVTYGNCSCNYLVRHSYLLTLLKVFALLWTEPSNSGPTDMSDAFSIVRYGETVYSEVRRYIAVKCFSHHSLCV